MKVGRKEVLTLVIVIMLAFIISALSLVISPAWLPVMLYKPQLGQKLFDTITAFVLKNLMVPMMKRGMQ